MNEKQAFIDVRKVRVQIYDGKGKPVMIYLVDSLIAIQEMFPDRSIDENFKEALEDFKAEVEVQIENTQKEVPTV